MTTLTHSFISAILIGLGATLTFDLWGLFMRQAFKIAPSNLCLVGRWIRYMPEGRFRHTSIGATRPKRYECAVGWIAHYLIGIMFATTFVALAGEGWLQQPAPMPALLFGIVSAVAPFFVMQPLFGLGVASARAPNPALARIRTLANHAAFGLGLYLFAVLIR